MLDWQKCKLLKTEKNKEMTSQQCFFYLKLYKECEMLHTYCQKKLSGLKISLGTYTYYISYYFGVFFGSHLYTKYYTLQGLKKNQIYFPDYFMLILCSDYHCLPLFVMNVHLYMYMDLSDSNVQWKTQYVT